MVYEDQQVNSDRGKDRPVAFLSLLIGVTLSFSGTILSIPVVWLSWHVTDFSIAVATPNHYNSNPHGLCSHETMAFVYALLKGISVGECR